MWHLDGSKYRSCINSWHKETVNVTLSVVTHVQQLLATLWQCEMCVLLLCHWSETAEGLHFHHEEQCSLKYRIVTTLQSLSHLHPLKVNFPSIPHGDERQRVSVLDRAIDSSIKTERFVARTCVSLCVCGFDVVGQSLWTHKVFRDKSPAQRYEVKRQIERERERRATRFI